MKAKSRALLFWSVSTFFLLCLDQWTKHLVIADIPLGSSIHISDYFDLVHLHNMGAAFSMLDSGAFWQKWGLTLLAIGVAIYLIFWIFKKNKYTRLQYMGASLICAGALGNAIDRMHFGYVIDFLAFHVNQWYWPAFNVADTAICIGAFCFILTHTSSSTAQKHSS